MQVNYSPVLEKKGKSDFVGVLAIESNNPQKTQFILSAGCTMVVFITYRSANFTYNVTIILVIDITSKYFDLSHQSSY
jgi:hypothetical protein